MYCECMFTLLSQSDPSAFAVRSFERFERFDSTETFLRRKVVNIMRVVYILRKGFLIDMDNLTYASGKGSLFY